MDVEMGLGAILFTNTEAISPDAARVTVGTEGAGALEVDD